MDKLEIVFVQTVVNNNKHTMVFFVANTFLFYVITLWPESTFLLGMWLMSLLMAQYATAETHIKNTSVYSHI
jgi:type IV secretory pathway TrbD component